jgi:hypothetical protein
VNSTEQRTLIWRAAKELIRLDPKRYRIERYDFQGQHSFRLYKGDECLYYSGAWFAPKDESEYNGEDART